MNDPLLVKAKEGQLSDEELEQVVAELNEVRRRRAANPFFLAPSNSLLDQLDQKVRRYRMQLTKHDRDAVARELRGEVAHGPRPDRFLRRSRLEQWSGGQPEHDPFMLLEIIGEAGGKELAEFVEPHLDSPGDPMVAGLALQILAIFWGMGEHYRSQILAFVDGVPWDEDAEVRGIAIDAAGDFVAKRWDPKLLGTLLRIAEDKSEDVDLRNRALTNLARARGLSSWQRLPRLVDIEVESDQANVVLKEAHTLLAREA